ncbi:MAG: helix-turn-helix domain-containing protein [Candidatus Rokubacteria bacterium]|nr:helix-turn-helix domain-containing protein [Candidatus Rokubacteria bacterium]
MTPKDVMSVKEASRYLSIDEATLTLLATERRIPSLELNGTWVFSKKSIDKWRSLRESHRA